MKILTILGTRPEIIRLSRVIPLLDETLGRVNHCLVHTGQNYALNLYMQFFYDLALRHPDVQLKMEGSFGEQVGQLLPQIERTLVDFRPDCVLILGDTNSSLAAIPAARLGIPVYHMEAGNRSYDPRSPEEVNRRLIDHCSAVHLPYTERSRANLLAEGIPSDRIFVTGNPIREVIDYYRSQSKESDVLGRLGLEAGRFFLVTLHRAENINIETRLGNFLRAFDCLQRAYRIPVIVSAHPHLWQRIVNPNTHLSIEMGDNPEVRFLDPLGFFDFIALQRSAFCTLSDSGTVQEESCLLGTPSVTLRGHTERPEAVECGASVLSGADPNRILDLVRLVTRSNRAPWTPPAEYLRANVAETVVRILTSHLPERRAL
jgi:UDP-N-acetylglucosamine 2-epimerase (non-hydrolysing)